MPKVMATLRRKHADRMISMLERIFDPVKKTTFRFESSVSTTMQGNPYLPCNFWTQPTSYYSSNCPSTSWLVLFNVRSLEPRVSSVGAVQDRQPASLSLLESYNIPRASLASIGRERVRYRESTRIQEPNVTCSEAAQKVSECLNEVSKFDQNM